MLAGRNPFAEQDRLAGRRCRANHVQAPGRQSAEDITLFKSLGIGLEDIAVAMKVYQKAKDAGVGRWLEV